MTAGCGTVFGKRRVKGMSLRDSQKPIPPLFTVRSVHPLLLSVSATANPCRQAVQGQGPVPIIPILTSLALHRALVSETAVFVKSQTRRFPIHFS